MEHPLTELLKGPTSESYPDRHAWFRKMFDVLSSDPNKSVQRIAAPFRQATELVAKVKTAEEDEKIQEELAGLLLQAQGLMMYSVLEQLVAARHAIAGHAAKQKAGSDQQKRFTKLQAVYEATITALGTAYNNFRAGKFEELKRMPEMLAEAQKLADAAREDAAMK